jgi:hypothetical protein
MQEDHHGRLVCGPKKQKTGKTISEMLLIFVAWIFCFLLSLWIGYGTLKLVSKFAKTDLGASFDVFYKFWFGFSVLIAFLQIASLFMAIGKTVFIIVSLVALVCAAINFSAANFKRIIRNTIHPKNLVAIIGVCLLMLLVAYCANKEVTHTDTFIYHYNAVKWAKEYPAVPGLVNLHGRLAFNSSFFLFAALTEIGPYAGNSSHVALSFLMVVCLIHWCYIIARSSEPMTKRIFCVFTFPFLLIHIAFKMDIASLSTDYPMAVVTMIFCLVCLDRIQNKALLLLPLAGVVFTLKLSGMLTVGFAVVATAGYLLQMRYQIQDRFIRKQQNRIILSSFVLLCLLVSGFVIRNIILSGWLLYPFPVGNLHLPWSSPKPYVVDMIDWIKSFPKIPGGASPQTIKDHSFFFWFFQWYDRFKQSSEFFMLIGSFIIILWSTLQSKSFSKFILGNLNAILVFLFAATSILFWFQSAPEIRFGSIYFYILYAAAIILLWKSSQHKALLRILVFGIFAYSIVTQLPAFIFDREPQLFTFAYTKQPKLVKVVASPQGENPPLYIYMPAEGNQCGDAPLPCTPYAGGLLHSHMFIRQRVPGDLSKGFLPPQQQ